MQREEQAHSPTKSERDSAGSGGLVQARDGGVAIPPVVARILSGDSTSPLTRDGHGCPKLNAQSFKQGCLKSATLSRCRTQRH